MAAAANAVATAAKTAKENAAQAHSHRVLSCYNCRVYNENLHTSLHGLTDSHFHSFAMAEKGVDPVSAVRKCKHSGMAEMIEIGLSPEDLEKRRALLEGISGVFFSSGFSPAHAVNKDWQHGMQTLEAQAESTAIAAIGEIGLDWHWNYGSRESQVELMEAQLYIAKAAKLPVLIHNREADNDILSLLRSAALPAAGILHCFSSDYTLAAKCIDLGYMISFAGNVTYKRTDSIRDAARKIPIESLLVETDAPYLSPQAVRGRVNTPQHIAHTYDFIAAARNVSTSRLAEQVRENLCRLLGSHSGPNTVERLS